MLPSTWPLPLTFRRYRVGRERKGVCTMHQGYDIFRLLKFYSRRRCWMWRWAWVQPSSQAAAPKAWCTTAQVLIDRPTVCSTMYTYIATDGISVSSSIKQLLETRLRSKTRTFKKFDRFQQNRWFLRPQLNDVGGSLARPGAQSRLHNPPGLEHRREPRKAQGSLHFRTPKSKWLIVNCLNYSENSLPI